MNESAKMQTQPMDAHIPVCSQIRIVVTNTVQTVTDLVSRNVPGLVLSAQLLNAPLLALDFCLDLRSGLSVRHNLHGSKQHMLFVQDTQTISLLQKCVHSLNGHNTIKSKHFLDLGDHRVLSTSHKYKSSCK